jgi:hypothetical protein
VTGWPQFGKVVVDRRRGPDSLAVHRRHASLAGMLDGDFEIHLTLLADPRLEGVAAAHGLKCTRILLDRGATPDQPMLTLRARGSLAAVAAEGNAWAGRLAGDGFTVVRVRVEARRRLDALVGELTAVGFAIAEIEHEYVVLDSNPAVDAGWIAT